MLHIITLHTPHPPWPLEHMTLPTAPFLSLPPRWVWNRTKTIFCTFNILGYNVWKTKPAAVGSDGDFGEWATLRGLHSQPSAHLCSQGCLWQVRWAHRRLPVKGMVKSTVSMLISSVNLKLIKVFEVNRTIAPAYKVALSYISLWQPVSFTGKALWICVV